MADVKVSALTALTGANLANGDQFLVTDVGSPNVSKSITADELAQGSQFSGRYASTADFPDDAWSAWTPTVTAQTGTITAYTTECRYKQYGKLVHCSFVIAITTKGTAAGSLKFTLPVTPAGVTGNSSGVVGGYAEVSNVFGFGIVCMDSTSGAFLLEADTTTPFNFDGDQFRGYLAYEAG